MLGITRQRISLLERAKRSPEPEIIFVMLSLMGRLHQFQNLFLIPDELIDLTAEFNYGFIGQFENVSF